MEPVNVVVDRKTWLRGEGPDRSYLLRKDDNKMCCLGFACLALGVPMERLNGMESPLSITFSGAGYRERLERFMNAANIDLSHNNDTVDMMRLNDGSDPDAAKEAELVERGAKIGLHFTFIN